MGTGKQGYKGIDPTHISSLTTKLRLRIHGGNGQPLLRRLQQEFLGDLRDGIAVMNCCIPAAAAAAVHTTTTTAVLLFVEPLTAIYCCRTGTNLYGAVCTSTAPYRAVLVLLYIQQYKDKRKHCTTTVLTGKLRTALYRCSSIFCRAIALYYILLMLSFCCCSTIYCTICVHVPFKYSLECSSPADLPPNTGRLPSISPTVSDRMLS